MGFNAKGGLYPEKWITIFPIHRFVSVSESKSLQARACELVRSKVSGSTPQERGVHWEMGLQLSLLSDMAKFPMFSSDISILSL